MERRQFGEGYKTNDAGGSNFQVPVSQPSADNVHFYDGLIPGLENLPPLSPASGGQNWNVGGPELGLGAFQHGFGGWTSYPTDDDVSYNTEGINNVGASSGFVTNEDYFTSLSQPDSVSGGSENNFYATRSRSHSEHYDVLGGMTGYDFSRLADTGRDVYSEAMGQWAASQPSEPRAYDLFGTNPLLQQTQHKPSKPQSRSATPETIEPATKNKPSYSEVARQYPPGSRPIPRSKESQAEKCQPTKTEGFPDYTGFRLPTSLNVHRNRSRPGKAYRSRRHHDVEPVTIKPDSRYGLDTFEQPAHCSKLGSGDHLSASSGSCPHSRKGSASSGTSSYCGVDELDPISPAEHLKRADSSDADPVYVFDSTCDSKRWSAGGVYNSNQTRFSSNSEGDKVDEASGGLERSPPATEPGKTEECKRKTEGESGSTGGTESKRPRSSSVPKSQHKINQPKEHVFFDPKRIFAPRPGKPSVKKTPPAPTSTSSQNCSIPNNQQPQASAPTKMQDSDNILNNDKPKTRPSSNINRSCYINNNLREPTAATSSTKKQTNAEAQRDSGNLAGHSHTNPQASSSHSHGARHAGHTRSRAGTGPRRADSHHKDDQHPRRRPDPMPKDDAPSRRRQDNKDEPLVRRKRAAERTERKTQTEWMQQHMLGDMVIQVWHWVLWAVQELGHVVWNITKLVLSLGIALLLMLGQHSFSTMKDMWIVITAKFYHRPDPNTADGPAKQTRAQNGLKENIALPSTGEEAMKRLLAGKGKDPYSILGVVSDASDDVIKKYYRRQAVLVHPDKNQMPGAEEAFKILGHAFDLIGEPEKRRLFDSQRLEAQEEEEALHQFADLLTKLHDKVQEATNLMRCENCGGKHRRVPTERPMYAARYCQRCDYSHPVREGDVWAESHMLGFLWNYYACMENRVYDITEWASCQCDRFKHIQANAHNIVYRIATNTSSGGRHRPTPSRTNEADLEDFLSHLFHQANGAGVPTDRGTAETDSQFGNFSGETRSGKPSWNQTSSAGSNKKGRRRKKKH